MLGVKIIFMPHLIVLNKSDGKATEYEFGNSILTIGSADSSDICIVNNNIKDLHCYIAFDGSDFHLSTPSDDSFVIVDGKKTSKGVLKNGDFFDISNYRIFVFRSLVSSETKDNILSGVEEIKKVVNFSEKLMSSSDLDELLNNLMKEVVTLTHAENGFLLLVEKGKIKLKTVYMVDSGAINASINNLSDSIIARVITERKPMIISDAVTDSEFKNAESVINLRLHSVMCVPLTVKDKLLGLIYLGSQSIRNLFKESDLEILKIFASQASLLIQNAILLGEMRAEHTKLLDKLGEISFGPLIGNSGAMQNMFREIKAIARMSEPVLLIGEDGTEKESVAYAIHKESKRSGQFDMLKAGIYNELQFDIEFSGVVKGGVPGALYTRRGKVHLCKNGTLYIEDIEKIPPSLQMKILGLIKDGYITKVGSATRERVDVRLIFSLVDIEGALESGSLNRELYNYLKGTIIKIPPLRERVEDIEFLATNFLERISKQQGKHISGYTPDAINYLKKQPWYGNITELESRIKRAISLCEGEFLTVDDFEAEL